MRRTSSWIFCSRSLAEIREELEDVKEGVDELLRQAGAARPGNVHGRNDVLRRLVTELHDARSWTGADWDAIVGRAEPKQAYGEE